MPPYEDPYRGGPPQQSEFDNPYQEHSYQQQSFQSTEKMIEEPVVNTERQRKGRQNIPAPQTWAEMGPPPRSTGILRMWRKDERGKQWSRGGGLRTFLRLCCCCTTLTVIIILSVILTLALVSLGVVNQLKQFVRPPSLKLNEINIGAAGVSASANAFSVQISLGISVANPNWFNVDFKEISADVTYPGTTSQFGAGTLYNVNFAGHTQSTFDFPLDLEYSTAIDPNRVILSDLISKCATSRSDVTVNYVLYLKLRILSFVIPFKVNSDASFTCPISGADIQRIAGNS